MSTNTEFNTKSQVEFHEGQLLDYYQPSPKQVVQVIFSHYAPKCDNKLAWVITDHNSFAIETKFLSANEANVDIKQIKLNDSDCNVLTKKRHCEDKFFKFQKLIYFWKGFTSTTKIVTFHKYVCNEEYALVSVGAKQLFTETKFLSAFEPNAETLSNDDVNVFKSVAKKQKVCSLEDEKDKLADEFNNANRELAELTKKQYELKQQNDELKKHSSLLNEQHADIVKEKKELYKKIENLYDKTHEKVQKDCDKKD